MEGSCVIHFYKEKLPQALLVLAGLQSLSAYPFLGPGFVVGPFFLLRIWLHGRFSVFPVNIDATRETRATWKCQEDSHTLKISHI